MDLADALETVDFESVRQFRLGRVRDQMERHDLDAIVAFEYANGRYIADLRPLYAPNFLLRQAVVISRHAADVVCLVHQDDTPHRRQQMSWLKPEQIREFPTAAFVEGASAGAIQPLRAALAELGVESGRVGIDLTTVAGLANLQADMPAIDWVDVAPAMNAARHVKAPGEIEVMRLGGRVVDAAMAVAIDSLTPGIRECEVLAEVMRVFYRQGAEVPQCNLIVCSGPNTVPMQRYAGYRRIERGDLVFMDIGACFGGMFVEATRTVCLGAPSEDQRAIHQLVYDVHMRVLDAMRPGVTAVRLQAAAGEVLDGSPYGRNMQKMVLIHGIGVGYAESPFVRPPGTPTAPLVMAEGMTVALVPTILVPGITGGGGVRLEDVIAITADGVELLTNAPYDIAVA